FGGVGVKRLPLPKPLSAEELNETSTYPVPEPDVVYFPPGFKTPLPVLVEGRRFEIDVPLGEAGLYAISIWGRFPDAEEQLRIVSLRTVRVEGGASLGASQGRHLAAWARFEVHSGRLEPTLELGHVGCRRTRPYPFTRNTPWQPRRRLPRRLAPRHRERPPPRNQRP